MLRKIESLRKQPKHVRNRYAFWIALSCTALVSLVWVLTLPDKINTFDVGVSDDTKKELSTFANVISDIKGNVSDSFANLRENSENTATTQASTTQDFSVLLRATTSEKQTPKNTVLIGTSSSASSTSE